MLPMGKRMKVNAEVAQVLNGTSLQKPKEVRETVETIDGVNFEIVSETAEKEAQDDHSVESINKMQ